MEVRGADVAPKPPLEFERVPIPVEAVETARRLMQNAAAASQIAMSEDRTAAAYLEGLAVGLQIDPKRIARIDDEAAVLELFPKPEPSAGE